MGLFSGITNTIGSVFSKGVKAASEWGGKAAGIYTAAKSGNILGMIGQVGSALMEKRTGGSGDWAPVDTSSGISVPGTGSYTMPFKKAGGGDYQIQDTSVAAPNLSSFGNLSSYRPGEARGVDQRLTTVDADTLNQEWEYRLTKGFRNKNLFT